MIIYTRYKHSKLATLMSGLGSVAVVGGVYLIAQSVGFMVGSGGTAGSPSDSVTGNVFGDIIVGIICMIVGVGIRILAQSVAEKKEAKLAVKSRVAEKTGIGCGQNNRNHFACCAGSRSYFQYNTGKFHMDADQIQFRCIGSRTSVGIFSAGDHRNHPAL